ncbi:hypothetical protein [Hymenobacter radiodurans]|uniref:hypothetical protein n=1 Tax=Hymenobacter radiodurans TaxID=2496028 RepID=UPI0010586CF4|nr:hypothetical protein [Hymenobacter radiodurans]
MPENTTVGQRFAQFIAYLGISKNAFAASLDKTATVIQHLVDERNKPGFDLLCKVFEVYPNLSKDWLLQGTGPMVAESGEAKSNADRAENNSPKPLAIKEKPAAATPAAVSIARPAPETSASQTVAEPEAETQAASPVAAPVTAAAVAQPPMPEVAAVIPGATLYSQVDPSWQTALYTQQMAHQLAMAELRNQHLQEQQRLMQQMLDLMQRKA